MQRSSRRVTSNQTGVHPDLERVVQRYLSAEDRRPPHPGSVSLLQHIDAFRSIDDRALVLDSGCGTGMSTAYLAREYPEALVIGVDKSRLRLLRGADQQLPENAASFHGDVVDVWNHFAEEGVRLHAHYMFYPNPWPKKKRLRHRWYAQSGFSSALKLGGELICRSNWSIFVEEMRQVVRLVHGADGSITCLPKTSVPVTLFEKKYREAGQELYEFRVLLD